MTKTDNLTQAERSALRDIQERDDIIIKPAEKGSAVVVMDKTTYLQKAERQLSDCRFYEKLDSDPLVNFRQKIETAWIGILWSKILHGLIVYVATRMHSL
jgi:hypothetical protein